MATTRLMTRHTGSGMTIMETLKDGFDYGKNPDKTRNGDLILAYECDPATADAEFLLSKAKYKAITGREQKRENDVLYYQIRQSFPPGETDPETALKISYDLAMRWTKGRHAFFVVSHADRPHPHCHIYYNSSSLDCTRKFRDFIGSARAVRRLSDRICLENGLSVITNPKRHSKGKFKHYGEWLGGHKPPTFQEERFTRLRASTLGKGYGQEDIQAAIDGKAAPQERRKVNLIVDIQSRMKAGKGPAYERWAKVFNLKQMAAALQYLQENGLLEYADLEQKTAELTDRFHTLSDSIKTTEAALHINAELKAAVVDYAKARPVFEGYKAAKYSRKYLAEHEADIAAYRAAQDTFRRLLSGAKLPKMDTLKAEFQRLSADKKKAYREYRETKKAMQEIVTMKSNIDHLLGLTDAQKNKEMER